MSDETVFVGYSGGLIAMCDGRTWGAHSLEELKSSMPGALLVRGCS